MRSLDARSQQLVDDLMSGKKITVGRFVYTLTDAYAEVDMADDVIRIMRAKSQDDQRETISGARQTLRLGAEKLVARIVEDVMAMEAERDFMEEQPCS